MQFIKNDSDNSSSTAAGDASTGASLPLNLTNSTVPSALGDGNQVGRIYFRQSLRYADSEPRLGNGAVKLAAVLQATAEND